MLYIKKILQARLCKTGTFACYISNLYFMSAIHSKTKRKKINKDEIVFQKFTGAKGIANGEDLVNSSKAKATNKLRQSTRLQ